MKLNAKKPMSALSDTTDKINVTFKNRLKLKHTSCETCQQHQSKHGASSHILDTKFFIP